MTLLLSHPFPLYFSIFVPISSSLLSPSCIFSFSFYHTPLSISYHHISILCSSHVHLISISQGRWAWGLEEPSQLEKDLVPRDVPSYWLLRTIILTLLSWSLLILNTLALTIVPLMTGRALFSVAHVPLWIQHDPISYIIGLCACFMAISLCQTLIKMMSSIKKLKVLKISFIEIPSEAKFKSKYNQLVDDISLCNMVKSIL